MELSPKTLLQGGKYKIIEKIGQGGFGIAYRAIHQGLQTEVCIKEFFYSDLCERSKNSSDITIISKSVEKIKLVDSLQKKFTKEAQRLAKFQHPNIVQVTDNFNENNTAYFVMEYLDGGSLDDLLKRNGAMSEENAKALILPILDAMDAVHKKNLLHLDIKPANIMLRKNQSPVLIDFGISKYLETVNGITTTAPIGISKGFAPLEQYGGSISDFSKSTDIYSLCATIYNMVTGLIPPEPLQMLTNGFKSPRDLRPQLSADFNAAILKGLAIKAVDRQQSILQLLAVLGEAKKNNQTIEETVIKKVEEIAEPVLETADAYFKRAESKRKKGKFQEAIEDYTEAIKKNDKNINFYTYRAWCFQKLMFYPDAIKDYTRIIELIPNEVNAVFNRGLCYSELGNNLNAKNDFFRAFELTQTESYFYKWMEMIKKSQDISSIEKYLSNTKWNNKDKVHFLRGEIYLNRCEYEKAINDFSNANEIKPLNIYLDYQIKAILKSEKIELFNSYLEKDLQKKDEVLYKRGEMYLKQGNDLKACDDFYQAYQLSKNEKYLELWRNTGNIKALSSYLEKDLPKKDEVLYKRGIIQINSGNKHEGIKDIKEAKKQGNKVAISYLSKSQPSSDVLPYVVILFLLNISPFFLALFSDIETITVTSAFGLINGFSFFSVPFSWALSLTIIFNYENHFDEIYNEEISISFRYFAKSNIYFALIIGIISSIYASIWGFSNVVGIGWLSLFLLLISIIALIVLWLRS